MVRGCNLWVLIASVIFSWGDARAQKLPLISEVEAQPLIAATERLIEALEYVGAPLSDQDAGNLKASMARSNDQVAIEEIQQILDPHCLVGVHINAESRVKVAEGPAQKVLSEQGWRTFLVKVHNEAGINPILKAESPHAQPVSARDLQTDQERVPFDQVRQRFLDIVMFNKQPLKPRLSGLPLEYRIIQLFSRDTGHREAQLAFNVGQGTQDIGFRNSVPILFECRPSIDVVFGIKDIDGKPTTAALEIRDPFDRVYPNPARRLAPDFFFHNQVYRADGESVTLPLGKYTVTVSRGPEYHEQTREITVRKGRRQREEFQLARWTHPARRRWYSGDHHIHAAGCLHYDSPTEGVGPSDIMRHILGEDLNVGCVLTWGLCWSTQKKYFEGTTSKLSQPNHLMRYDVEVSGFPSSHAGHLCLLRLSEDDYPGTKTPAEWPSWTLPVLKWAKEQGGVVGYSHTGWGLGLPDHDGRGNRMGEISYPHKFSKLRTGRAADTLPDYAMPPFDGIGANEYIVTVTHDVCHFISTADTPAIWELNIWYHTLNCGMRTRISGETDFPCIYGDKVGLGRVYVKLPRHEKFTFDNWIRGVRDGRSYCGDGRSHVFDFKVNEVAVGESGSDGKISQLNLDQPAKVKVRLETTALLAEKPTPETEAIRTKRLDEKPYWHIERCRIDGTRRVPVEVIVNGLPVARREIEADGSTQSLSFDIDLQYSSWVAVRIFPSVHTNPVFVEVGGKPIRASRRSAQWCRKAVDVCWNAKKGRIREEEMADAKSAYNKARKVYDEIIAVSIED